MKISNHDYAESLYSLLEEIPQDKTRDVLKRFVVFLRKKGDLSKANLIVRELEKIWQIKNNIQKIELSSAKDLDLDNLKKKFGKSKEIFLKKEPSLIGGLRVKLGDKLIDNTVKARLNRLKEALHN